MIASVILPASARTSIPATMMTSVVKSAFHASRTEGYEPLAVVQCVFTSLAAFGAEYGTPIINHPEAAVLAIGLIEPRAIVVDGHVQARDACTLSLSFDHRLMDGAEAGRALRALADLLENPFALGRLPL